jgi:methyltransferase-like protein
VKKKYVTGQWWHMPLILALGRKRQADSEFKASLVYRVNSRIARALQRNSVSKNKNKNNNNKKLTSGMTMFLYRFQIHIIW